MEYSYQAKTKLGKLVSGSVEATSEEEAVNVLQQRDLIVLSIKSAAKKGLQFDVGTLLYRVKPKEIAAFTRQFATLLDADVPVVEGLHTLGEQSVNPVLGKVIQEIADSVDAGMPLSQAFAKFPKHFSRFYISLIKAGESAGRLHQSLLYMADYLEELEDLKSTTKGALTYPVFIFTAMIAVTAFLMIYVMPEILTVLEESGVTDLPFTTKILITATGIVNDYLYVIMIASVFLGWFMFAYARSEEGRELLDNLKLKLPIIGDITKGIYIARIATTLSTLMKSGVQILEALRIAGEVVGNSIYENAMIEAEKAVAAGSTISSVFGKYPELIPPLVTQMIAVGERTGKIDMMLDKMAIFYKQQAKNMTQNLSTLIEPVLILVIGIGVAIIVSSILLPIYSLISAG